MAVEGEAQPGEVQSHVKSYSLFTWLMKWGTIVSFIVAMIVVILISS